MHLSKETHPTRKILIATLLVGIASILATQIWFLTTGTSADAPTVPVAGGQPARSHLASILVASADASVQRAPSLLGIRIEPANPGGHMLMTSETMRFTSIGIFDAMEQQIAATWSVLRGTSEQPLSHCRSSSTCEFTAGAQPEQVSIFARAGGFYDRADIEVQAPATHTFTDTIPSWAGTAIVRLQNLGIVRGYDDGRYGPGDSLTRGQVVTLLARTLEQAQLAQMPSSCGEIPRVATAHYAYRPLCLFVQNEWETSGDFNPDEPLARGEAAAYINRIFGPALLGAMSTSQGAILAQGQVFADLPVSHWYFFDAGVANVTGIMTGNPDGTFGAERTLNRAEAATIVDRLLQAVDRLGIARL
ncbi:MAG: S-layer homology domain-containing protein [Candidatus Peribacteraceae bacterium]|nr:S-layer homology domain-containing protein [Candidatus Peribacteraceae bacterium]